MPITIALIGAGGKMGGRLVNNLKNNSGYRMLYCETAPAGVASLRERGLTVTDGPVAVSQADIVILAVPDRVIRVVSATLIAHIRPNATIVLLDPAAAMADEVAIRPDVNYVVCHPCHPPLFGEQPTPEARKDFFGGVSAWQDIVIALMRGSEEAFAAAERVCKAAFAPVRTAHRITVEQMAILEPAMAEVVACSAAMLMHEAMEQAIQAGVPRPAAEAFMLGHAQIPLAIVFGAIQSPFSDAAKIAIRWGTQRIINPDWRRVFEPDQVRAAVRAMLHPEENP